MAETAPSKTALLERRGERDLVSEGKTVLEERRDLLARLMWEQTLRVESLQDELATRLGQARSWGRRAMARHGVNGLARYGPNQATTGDVEWSRGNRFGIEWIERDPAVRTRDEGSSRQPGGESLEIGQAESAMRRLVELLIELAAAEGNLVRITHGFRRTQRRVNALEHIILPEIEASIRHIEAAMDEVERDDLVRTSLIKQRQTE